ncbi:ribonuclease HI [Micromonospora chokoriensis]|uniref:ribonuclease HI n=1 Tax=Micromonospora chokoriensis TaxID=356851 RepID=UPI0018DC8267|nr:RNase H family protein [Micromonospora chokoriensis]
MATGQQEPEVRLCTNCRYIVVREDAQWAHPAWVIDRFPRYQCELPDPGRLAKPREVRAGWGTDVRKDDFSHQSEIEEFALEAQVRVLLGTDGSYRHVEGMDIRQRPICWGYVGENGIYGLGAARMPHRIIGARVLQTELRAMWWSLRRLIRHHPVRILSDSQDALDLISLWRYGSEQMPPGYTLDRAGGRKSTILQLAHLVAENADRISVEKVRGHTGHPLNEGADALAKIARAWATGRISKQTAHADARSVARNTVARYVSSTAQ